MNNYYLTSESVTEGHPDKLCDQISDAILDAVLAQDANGHVACETAATTGIIYVMGEITAKSNLNIPAIVREVISDIGYSSEQYGLNASSCAVITSIDEQSGDIALGVNFSHEKKAGSTDTFDAIGAGDQGMMFGFACDETPELMPLTISLAHKLAKQLTVVRKSGLVNYLGPDGKSQVTIEYANGIPKRVETIVVSAQHLDGIEHKRLVDDIVREVILPIIPSCLIDKKTKFYVNPTGSFVKGGPCADSGLTGRKIIVDTYGGVSRHGGGAFSGKDPTKVDRSGAYAARYVAKNIVASKLAKRCEVQLAYAIGIAQPVSIMVDTFGSGIVSDREIEKAVHAIFDLRPAAIMSKFDLQRPIYRQFAAYGHMGREDIAAAKWEQTDKVSALQGYFHHDSR